jgi:hypothetical protein
MTVRGPIRRVGNSFALLIPAAEARRGNLKFGQVVEATIETEAESPLGLLADLPYEEFDSKKEGYWPDRF